MDPGKINDAIELLLEGLGLDLSDPNLSDTPARVTRAYQEIFSGLAVNIDDEVTKILESSFPCTHQQMVVAKNLVIFSMCPHHLLPVQYVVTVGYMPGANPKDARVIGLSKLARITQLYAARPVLQEQMLNEIVDALMRIPGCAGAGCIAHGEHYCMKMRGVKQAGSVVVTSSLKGEFLTHPMVRSEFLGLSR